MAEEMMAPEGAEPMEQEGSLMSEEDFMAGANEGAGPEGRGSHVMEFLNGKENPEQDQKMGKQLETINAAMMDMMYDPKTKRSIQKSLKDVPPEESIPSVTNMLMSRFEDIMKPKNGEMSLDMKLGVGVMTFTEVTTLAATMGVIPEELPEQQNQELLTKTMQQYIQRGLKEKTIDPVELQMAVEPLLTPEEQALGRQTGQGLEVPGQPTQQMGNAQMMDAAKAPLAVKNQQLEKSNASMNTALQGIAAQPEEGM